MLSDDHNHNHNHKAQGAGAFYFEKIIGLPEQTNVLSTSKPQIPSYISQPLPTPGQRPQPTTLLLLTVVIIDSN